MRIMYIFLLVFSFSSFSFEVASSSEGSTSNTKVDTFTCPVNLNLADDQIEVNNMFVYSNDLDENVNEDERWSDYKTDGCLEEIDNQGIDTQLYRCKDGTIVHRQPESTGIGGWNGYCGETAMANINYMFCGMISSPDKYCHNYTRDGTPGTRPGVLKNVMNDYFDSHPSCPDGVWEDYYESSTAEDYIAYLRGGLKDGGITTRKVNGKEKKITPFPILLDSFPLGGSDRHWVTVVDVEGFEGSDVSLTDQDNCKVVVNHWANQYKVPCHRLAKAAEYSGNGAVGLVTGSYPRVKFVTGN